MGGIAKQNGTMQKMLYHAFQLLKYVDVYETTNRFTVPRAFSNRRSARFKLVYEPGGYWTRRRGTKR
jgi:hypothetical protein